MASNTIENKQVFKKLPGIESHPAKLGRNELKAIIWFACSVFLLLCLVSYDPKDPSFNVVTTRSYTHNLCGLFGSHLADALAQIVGVCSLVIPLFLVMMAIRCFNQTIVKPTRFWDYVSFISLTLILCALIDRFSSLRILNFSPLHPGGAVGSLVNTCLFKFFGQVGSLVFSLAILLICVLELSKGSLFKLMSACFPSIRGVQSLNLFLRNGLKVCLTDFVPTILSFLRSRQPGKQNIAPGPNISKSVQDTTFLEHEPLEKESLEVYGWERLSFLPSDEAPVPVEEEYYSKTHVQISANKAASSKTVKISVGETSEVPWKSIDLPDTSLEMVDEESTQAFIIDDQDLIEEPHKLHKSSDTGFTEDGLVAQTLQETNPSRSIKVTKRADVDLAPTSEDQDSYSNESDYRLPPTDLLDIPEISQRFVDEKLLETNASILEQKLADLGIKGQVVEIHPGPVITMYEITLAPGIPLRRVLNTSDDLAMALKSGSTRVVAPIPGKDTVGIEVPNLYREIVYFREIIESPVFKSSNLPLKMALGKCIDGEPFATSLAKMPHLLIAGATGTGKSVGLNSLICSWLMSYSPDEVKFIMVDPKKLELSYYQDIPHLIYPVVTDPDKVPKVLSWAIREMERRYDLLSQAGAKNIEGYNHQIQTGSISSPEGEEPPQKLPYLIIIVDELAELMMVAAKDIEISIARLAQMARAAGIHLILATQRPSVDVITGIIKANFPARISFQVSAKPDSRTIIDTVGAENLLGMGDMLFLPPGTSKLQRLHGAFVSENEIRRIADFTKAQRSPVYLTEISNIVNGSDTTVSSGSDSIDDEKYDEAVALVTRIGHASISLIQRHMRIGYNRAARIIETMETQGLIGPSDGTSRPREVLALSLDHIPDH
ncbi:MAG: DNA translocase FtsK [Deltaproteobacteria bacterium]|nr:DNA translocase FtsK [Deltaproteobacteria bacterium]